jgi:predicted negative regulator of RcsB-dependent stress response
MEQETIVKPKKNIKFRLKGVILILLIAVIGYGYFWYQDTNTLRQEATSVLESAEKFDVLSKALNEELDRCKTFISEQEGDFGSFEYCKKFIEWANSNSSDLRN